MYRTKSRQGPIQAALMVALALCLSWPGRASAQGTTADIVGIVTDPSGAVLPGVTATTTNVATGVVHTAVSDATGTFRLLLLPVGTYRVTVALQGFRTATTEVVLAVGDRVRFDTALELGDVAESVNVVAESPILQTQTSSVGTLTDARSMQELPINGRNFIRLAQIAPGVTEGPSNSLPSGNRPDDRRQSSSLSINGGDPALNNFLVDGLDNNERFIGTVLIRPNVDAIQEMKVDTSNFSAEQGRSAGGVINILTKSGTNQVNGSSYFFYRNESLDAADYFARDGEKPPYDLKQFGGSIGGPIRRNQTFFFGDYAGLRVTEGQTFTSTVPTAAMRAGTFSAVAPIYDPLTGQRFPGDIIPANRFDPAAAAMLNLLPLPQTDDAVNNYTQSGSRTQDDDSFDVRVDHRFANSDSLFARYSFNNTTTVVPERFPSVNGISPGGGDNFPGHSDQRAQQLGLGYTRALSPALILDLKGGVSRYVANTVPSNFGVDAASRLGIPNINVDADSSGLPRMPISGYFVLGDWFFIPLLNENTVYETLGNLTYLRGAHTLKVGADLKLRDFFAFQSPRARGEFSFNSNFTSNQGERGTGDAIASFLLGYPSNSRREKYLVEPTYQATEAATYLQDDWRVRPWLTLNLGIRYDYYSPLTEEHNQISNIDLAAGRIGIAGADLSRSAGIEPDRNDVSPRLGFALTLRDRTVVRGGYALSFTPPFVGSPLALRNPPFISLYNQSPSQFVPENRLSDGLPPIEAADPANPTGNLSPVAFDLKTPYVHQFNVTVQRELPRQLVATAAFVEILRRDELGGGLQLNNPPPGPGSVGARRPFRDIFPDVGGIGYTANVASTDYRALLLQLERRFTSGWGGRVAYTLSKSDTTSPDGQYPFSETPAGANPFPRMLDFVRHETGPSGEDRRHRLTFNLSYELPFAEEASGVAGALARGWQVNLIGVFQSGTPFTVTNASPRANTGGGDRPNQIADPELPRGERTVARWFNTAAFEVQPLFTLGNVGVNSLYGPGLATVDLSLFKTFLMGEARTQFRLEVFNLFNRANFGNPNSAFGSSAFGVINSTVGRGRNVQLALKVLF
jgi:outer membrane receptor protein involved in Fe transport